MLTPPLYPPGIRDLSQALLGPALMRLQGLDPRGPIWQPGYIEHWLQELIQAPQQQSGLPMPGRLLGAYFERLIDYYLRHTPLVAECFSQLQVPGPKGTLGEFDFLYRPTGEKGFCHLEVAVKFFLRPQAGRQLSAWIGPNPHDRLDIKVRHLLRHQLRLSDNPQAQTLLNARQIQVVRRECLLKGCLFYPWEEFQQQRVPPWSAAPAHWAGWWIAYARLSAIKNQKMRYRILDRAAWLRLDCAGQSNELLNWGALKALVDQGNLFRPQMVTRLIEQEGLWVEKDRGFVVPQIWLAALPA